MRTKVLLRVSALLPTLVLLCATHRTWAQSSSTPQITGVKLLDPGTRAPDFTLKSLEGSTITLSSYVGKNVIILFFYSIFCDPSRKLFSFIDDLQDKYGPDGLLVIGVNLDGEPFRDALISRKANGYKYRFLVVLDEQGNDNKYVASDQYLVAGTPACVLVGKDGLVKNSILGKDMQRINAAVVEALDIGLSCNTQSGTLLVVKVEKLDELNGERYLVKMANGDTVSIAKENIDDMMTQVANKVKEDRAGQQSSSEVESAPASTNYDSIIRAHCKGEWPNDFKMQKFCIDRQEAGLQELSSRSMRGELSVIRTKCSEEWPDDFKMRNFCEEQQLKAYKELNR